jgi:hypothetical protein
MEITGGERSGGKGRGEKFYLKAVVAAAVVSRLSSVHRRLAKGTREMAAAAVVRD